MTVCKTRPPLVTVAMTDKQCCSHTATHVLLMQWKIHRRAKRKLTKEDRAGYFWYETRSRDPQLLNWVILKEIQTINTVLCLFNMPWQITVLPQFKHMNWSSFRIYLKHEMNMNKRQKVFYFNRGTHHLFKFKSTEVNLLFCLICG